MYILILNRFVLVKDIIACSNYYYLLEHKLRQQGPGQTGPHGS